MLERMRISLEEELKWFGSYLLCVSTIAKVRKPQRIAEKAVV